MDIKELHRTIESSRKENIDYLKEFVKIPSLGNNPQGISKCVNFLSSLMLDAGISPNIFETDGNPIVYGEKIVDEKKPTILFYGHYDVQPTGALKLWETPPFIPTEKNGRLYGRGVGDCKGQLMAHILATKYYLEIFGDLPINLKFIIEGEEENGSTSLEKFAKQNKDLLLADLVYISDSTMALDDTPIINLGSRGVMHFNLEIHTAYADNHSGNRGGAIENSAWELVKVLSSMVDNEGNVLIDGFYEGVSEPESYELEMLEKLPFDQGRLADIYEVKSITKNKIDFFKDLLLKPTLTINEINSGYSCCKVSNKIPGRAEAKMEVRLSHNQNPEKIKQAIKNHIHKVNPYVKITPVDNVVLPAKSNISMDWLHNIIKSIDKVTTKEPLVVPSCGGSLPDFIWSNILSIPSISVPYANIDENNHGPNENLKLDLFNQGIKISAQIIHDFEDIMNS